MYVIARHDPTEIIVGGVLVRDLDEAAEVMVQWMSADMVAGIEGTYYYEIEG